MGKEQLEPQLLRELQGSHPAARVRMCPLQGRGAAEGEAGDVEWEAEMSADKQTARIGKGKPGPGRPKGKPNKATADVRACVAMICQQLMPEAMEWIRKGAKKNPLGAAKVLADLSEYHIPKLSRTEHTGEGGGPVQLSGTVTFIDGTSPRS